jgi:hypothetical protein
MDQLENMSSLFLNSTSDNNNIESSTLSSSPQHQQQQQQLPNYFDSYLDQYESNLLEHTLLEKKQLDSETGMNKLFQSFQTAACAVAQMFKEISTTSNTTNNSTESNKQNSKQMSNWQTFQNAAGAVTLLYKRNY